MWCWATREASDSEEFDEDDIYCHEVPSGIFAPPMPVSRSGGTAAFFRMRYVGDPSDPRYAKGDDYWIGKDVSRALEELRFYEQIRNLDPQGFRLLHTWCMQYGGVCSAKCATDASGTLEDEERQLLLLQNLRHGLKACRMLDVKIGEETGVAGWKGKSRGAATRNKLLDRLTNSHVQGFRLEGFDHQPMSLRTQATAPPPSCAALHKKSKRFKLQRLQAQEFFMFWIDNADLIEDDGMPCAENSESLLLPIEYSECLLFDAVRQLASICVDARHVPVPQMWIGSSLAFACEGAALPLRRRAFQVLSSREVLPQSLVRVKMFDWGRSELNTPMKDLGHGMEEKLLRNEYWVKWQRGALRVFYDGTILYRRQFAGQFPGPGCELRLKVWDYDTLDANDLIGVATLPLKPTNGEVVVRLHRNVQSRKKLKSEVVLEISQLELPAGEYSRLTNAWRVKVHGVRNLPRMDVFSASDPLISFELYRPGCASSPQALTPVVWNDNNAEYDVHLDFGEARSETVESVFAEISTAFGERIDPSWFPLEVETWSDGFEEFLAKTKLFNHLVRYAPKDMSEDHNSFTASGHHPGRNIPRSCSMWSRTA